MLDSLNHISNQIYSPLPPARIVDIDQTAIAKAVEDLVRQLLESLRGADDRIDFIAVLGGSPEQVADALKKARPHLPIYCPSGKTGQDASLFANLRGFQEWAEAAAGAAE